MTRGRKPGYAHSEQTKNKIRHTLTGKPHPEERKANISIGKSLYELDEKCVMRLSELQSTYPEQKAFFVDNRDELLFAMHDVRTEKELTDIRRHVESASLRQDEPYQYSSSSCFAAEDALIELLDVKRFLQKFH